MSKRLGYLNDSNNECITSIIETEKVLNALIRSLRNP
ncbi:hypothetical protein LR003_00995 [candidate division NPL-UPA2 bacterium]|nr:hypothetical protein [candidate division NPL-UPA2 bacterium]